MYVVEVDIDSKGRVIELNLIHLASVILQSRFVRLIPVEMPTHCWDIKIILNSVHRLSSHHGG